MNNTLVPSGARTATRPSNEVRTFCWPLFMDDDTGPSVCVDVIVEPSTPGTFFIESHTLIESECNCNASEYTKYLNRLVRDGMYTVRIKESNKIFVRFEQRYVCCDSKGLNGFIDAAARNGLSRIQAAALNIIGNQKGELKNGKRTE